MSDKEILLEAIGIDPVQIQTNIMSAYEELNILRGDKESGTRYAISYSNISQRPSAQSVLMSVAKHVTSWNSSIRAYDRPDTQLRVVYLVASVIPALAKYLYNLSLQTKDKQTIAVFSTLAKSHHGINTNASYANIADAAYSAWLSAIELGVASRLQTPVEEDYHAEAVFEKLTDGIGYKINDIHKVVVEMVDGVQLNNSVTDDQINSAARWVFLNDSLVNDIFGANKVDQPWYNTNDSLANLLFKYTKYSLSNTDSAKANKAEEKSMAINPDTHVVKDVTTIGQNTEQMNMLNENTKFTCMCYFKVYSIDGLRAYKFTDTIGHIMYKLMQGLMSRIGYSTSRIFDEAGATHFADQVKAIFAEAATKSTSEALDIRASLIEELAGFEEDIPKDAEQFGRVFLKLSGRNADEDSRDQLSQAIQKIRTDILYVGKASVSGTTPEDEDISATKLAAPVFTFGDRDPTDRNAQDDLNQAGKITRGCFSYSDGSLHIAYNKNLMSKLDAASKKPKGEENTSSVIQDVLVDKSLVIDDIPENKIRELGEHYVSSILMPAKVSHSDAWIMLYGIVPFTKYSQGDLEDSIDVSPLTRETNRVISDSNILQDTRVDMDARKADIMSSEYFVKGLAKCEFLDPMEASEPDKRVEFIQKIKDTVDPAINDSLTKIRAVCDNYTQAVKAYANAVGDNDDFNGVVKSVYRVTPSLDALIAGKQNTVDKIVMAFAKSKYPEQVGQHDVVLNALVGIQMAYNSINTCNQYYRGNSYVCLSGLMSYVSNINKAMIALQGTELAAKIQTEYLPTNYDELSDQVIALYRSVMNSKSNVAEAKAHADDIEMLMNDALTVDMNTVASLSSAIKKQFTDMYAAIKNPNIELLHQELSKVPEYIEKNSVTNQMLIAVKNAIASAMEGDRSENIEKLNGCSISQFVLPVKVFRMATAIAGVTNASDKDIKADMSDIQQSSIFAFGKGGEAPMDELTPFHPSNIGNARMKLSRRNDDNAIDAASIYQETPAEGDYLEKILDAVASYEESGEAYEAAKAEIDDVIEFAKEIPHDTEPSNPDKYKRIRQWIDIMATDPDSSRQSIAYAIQCAKKMKAAEDVNNEKGQLLDNYCQQYPSFTGMITALRDFKITSDDLRRAMKYLDAAAAQRDSMAKFKSYSAANVEDYGSRRMFAYTASDESTIAQIMCVLGTYIAAPSDDTLDDLIDSMRQVDNVINKYSKNKLSVKVSSKVMKTLTDLRDRRPNSKDLDEVRGYEADVSATIVGMINQLGGFILSRNHDELDVNTLQKMKSISRPTDQSPGYGKAIDSFARSQMRSIPQGYTSDQIKKVGGDDESAVRMSYKDLVAQDMHENPQLAKFAYALGNAFHAYDRTLKDARVSTLDDRAFHGVFDSLKGVELFKGQGTSDLQREIVSAIIDDERSNDKNYPTVEAVVNAAMTGGKFNSYSQMYSAEVKSRENILNDQKTATIAFDGEGNRSDPEKAVPLDRQTITVLATKVVDPTNDDARKEESLRVNRTGPFEDIPDLVHSVRMCIFEKLYRAFGKVKMSGDIEYQENYQNRANDLLDSAMRSMYNLCDGMDTPIADIILLSTSFGQKLGRMNVMKHVKQQLDTDDDLDLEYAGMVSNEPNAYPQMVSDEASDIDVEWIRNVTELLGMIPDNMSVSDVLAAVEMYNGSDYTRQQMARDDDRLEVLRIIDQIQKVDTATGIPVGFWGNDSGARKKRIKNIFNALCSYKKTTDMDWDDCAAKLREQFMEDLENGGNLLAINNNPTSDEARRRIGHLRINPYYAANIRSHSAEYSGMMQLLVDNEIVSKHGRIVKLKYPGMTFDIKTFDYIVNVALDNADKLDMSENPIALFTTTLMLFTNGMRIKAYVDMRRKASVVMARHKDLVRHAETGMQSSDAVKPESYDEMIKTSLGWITPEAYAILCSIAVARAYKKVGADAADLDKRIETEFVDAFKELTAGGNVSDNLDSMDRAPVKKSKRTVNDNGNPEPSDNGESTPEATKPVKVKKPRKPSAPKTEQPTIKHVGSNKEPPVRSDNYTSNTYGVTDEDTGEVQMIEVNSNATPPRSRHTTSAEGVAKEDMYSALERMAADDAERVKNRKGNLATASES